MDKKKIPELRFPGFEGEWEEKKLGEIGSLKKGKGIPKDALSNEGTKCILYGQLYTTYNETICEVESKTGLNRSTLFWGESGDVLIPSSGESAMDISLVSALLVRDVALGGDINVFRPKKDKVDSEFLSYQINSARKKDLYKIAEGASVVHIYNSNLKDVLIKIPPLIEQEKIASFFSLLNKKIEKQEEKIGYIEEYKKGMMQKLFPLQSEKEPELRFKGFSGAWEEKRLGDVLIERNIKVNDGDYKVISSTTKGLFYQSDYFDRDIASTNRSDYKILKQNQIVFSPQNLWMGNINYNKIIEIGIVSPSYKIYDVKKSFKADYIGQILKTPYMMYQYVTSSEQGASVVRRNLNMDLFNLCIIKAPPFMEQEKISFFLAKLDQLIILNQDKLEALKELKKGLMQKMFV